MKIIFSVLLVCVAQPILMCASAQDIPQYNYEAMKTLIRKYERPWTFVELWAGKGNLSFQVAAQHKNAVCVMASSDTELIKACNQHAQLKNLIGVSKELDLEYLINMGDCEHIDCTFVPDITLHILDWQKGIDALLNFGDYIIMQAPPLSSGYQKTVERYMKDKGGILIAAPPSHLESLVGSLYLFSVHKKFLLKRYWLYQKIIRPGEYTIKSTFKEKKLIKNKIKPKEYAVTEWIPGINLFTFKKLLGMWPTKEAIIKLVLPMENIQHNDFRISNLIIQGHKIVPIDGDSKGHENTAAQFLPHLLEQLSR